MLSIKNLGARVEGKQILNGLNLEVGAGEVHAIMGPNGSGKSTLASVLAGRENYEVTGGEVIYDGEDLLELLTGQRAQGVNSLRNKERSFVVITHYQRLLDYIVPDFVHVLYNGKIVKSGKKDLALELEKKGYDWLKEEITA